MLIHPSISSYSNTPSGNNPKGKVCFQGQIYSLLGYFNYLDSRETATYKVSHKLKPPKISENYEFRGCGNMSRNGGMGYEETLGTQLVDLNLAHKQVLLLCSNYLPVFVFALDHETASIFEKVPCNITQSLIDYLDAHEVIPNIVSDYCLAGILAKSYRKDDRVYPNHFHQPNRIDSSNIKNVLLGPDSKTAPTYKDVHKESIEEKEAREKREENDIFFCANYDETLPHSETTFLHLHKRIVAQAHRIGGFVEFTYKGKVWKIPKVPLIAWANNAHNCTSTFDYNGQVWRVYSPNELKTDGDSAIHSDWWIGAGIPVKAYGLYSAFHRFNHAISLFAFEVAGRNTLDNITTLSGKELSPVSGRCNVHPQSLNDVREGDILVLKNGGIDFELYLKKACSNGAGGVILEVGNKVTHLSIVANELGYRVMLLPNVINLIGQAQMVTMDTAKRTLSVISNEEIAKQSTKLTL